MPTKKKLYRNLFTTSEAVICVRLLKRATTLVRRAPGKYMKELRIWKLFFCFHPE